MNVLRCYCRMWACLLRNSILFPAMLIPLRHWLRRSYNKSQQSNAQADVNEFYIFHNQPNEGVGYTPVMQRFLPLDEKWKDSLQQIEYPGKMLPQVAGNKSDTLFALIGGYLFASLFKACAESLASENASRLEAMQRAEKNIGDLLDDLNKKYHRLRQSSIDEELFDVVSGFEALKGASRHKR